MKNMAGESFADRVLAAGKQRKSALVVGLDPVLSRFPNGLRDLPVEEALVAFGRGVIDAVREFVVAVKPQIAFYEQFGWPGWRAFQSTVEYARERDVLVIADAKRGDIGSTAEAYAQAFLGDDPSTPGPYVDALTINPYLGGDSVQPFLDRALAGGKGLFLLARTSNPGGADFQNRKTDGEPLYLAVAKASQEWMSAAVARVLGDDAEPATRDRYGALGLVAGATFPHELAEIRAAAPRSLILLPGLGAQGGKPEDLRVAFDERGQGALASSSRAIIYAYQDSSSSSDWTEAVAESADQQRRTIQDCLSLSS